MKYDTYWKAKILIMTMAWWLMLKNVFYWWHWSIMWRNGINENEMTNDEIVNWYY